MRAGREGERSGHGALRRTHSLQYKTVLGGELPQGIRQRDKVRQRPCAQLYLDATETTGTYGLGWMSGRPCLHRWVLMPRASLCALVDRGPG